MDIYSFNWLENARTLAEIFSEFFVITLDILWKLWYNNNVQKTTTLYNALGDFDMKEKEANKKQKTKVFDIKVNKEELEKFMARFFWYTLAFLTLLAVALFCWSAVTLYSTIGEVWSVIYNTWVMVRVPLVSNILCIAWFWIVYVFIKLIRDNNK